MALSIREEQNKVGMSLVMVEEEGGTMEVGQDISMVVVEGRRTCLC